MKLVVDANILFSFFKKDSFTRRFILSHPEIELFTSLYVFEELEEHKGEIKSKARIDDTIFELSSKELSAYVTIVPLDEFKEFWEEAEQISPDPDNAQYLAVALSLDCAIWSNDKDLKEKQYRVVVVTTEELTKLLGNSTNLT
ncbi:MAG: PIN domain-containing protein [archaeon]|nr:PIN domain-containing protein [archaeon]